MIDAFGLPQAIVLLVALERLGELAVARRNTRRLLMAGGREIGAGHYPLFILLHSLWLLAIFVSTPPASEIFWPAAILFALLQPARLWVIASLGRYWTTRIITIDDAPLVRHGPYRLFRHPNYAIVIAEMALLPLAFGQLGLAVVFSLANLLLIRHRIRVESTALAPRDTRSKESAPPSGSSPLRQTAGDGA